MSPSSLPSSACCASGLPVSSGSSSPMVQAWSIRSAASRSPATTACANSASNCSTSIAPQPDRLNFLDRCDTRRLRFQRFVLKTQIYSSALRLRRRTPTDSTRCMPRTCTVCHRRVSMAPTPRLPSRRCPGGRPRYLPSASDRPRHHRRDGRHPARRPDRRPAGRGRSGRRRLERPAVDIVSCALMRVDPHRSSYLRYLRAAGYGPISLDEVTLLGDDLREISRQFAVPSTEDRMAQAGSAH